MDVDSKTFKHLLADLPKRLTLLISKFIGVKGAIWVTATALLYMDKFDVWAWVAISFFLVVGRELFKHLKDLR